jgi:hypothetical protein
MAKMRSIPPDTKRFQRRLHDNLLYRPCCTVPIFKHKIGMAIFAVRLLDFRLIRAIFDEMLTNGMFHRTCDLRKKISL